MSLANQACLHAVLDALPTSSGVGVAAATATAHSGTQMDVACDDGDSNSADAACVDNGGDSEAGAGRGSGTADGARAAVAAAQVLGGPTTRQPEAPAETGALGEGDTLEGMGMAADGAEGPDNEDGDAGGSDDGGGVHDEVVAGTETISLDESADEGEDAEAAPQLGSLYVQKADFEFALKRCVCVRVRVRVHAC